jgi:hypothetical protein
LQQGSTAAATTLLKVMVDASTPSSTRVRAAEAVLNHADKAIEIEDIEVRLTELEKATAASKPSNAAELISHGRGMRAACPPFWWPLSRASFLFVP